MYITGTHISAVAEELNIQEANFDLMYEITYQTVSKALLCQPQLFSGLNFTSLFAD